MEIFSAILAYKYTLFTLGMFFLGETVFLPALYVAFDGGISFTAIFIIAFVVNIISDIAWYYLARAVPVQKVKHWKRVERHRETFNKLSHLFHRHGFRIIFLSKFVYGTRIIVQIISGINKFSFWKYFIANSLGTLTYNILLVIITLLVKESLADSFLSDIRIALVILFVLAIGINIWLRSFIQKRWFQ